MTFEFGIGPTDLGATWIIKNKHLFYAKKDELKKIYQLLEEKDDNSALIANMKNLIKKQLDAMKNELYKILETNMKAKNNAVKAKNWFTERSVVASQIMERLSITINKLREYSDIEDTKKWTQQAKNHTEYAKRTKEYFDDRAVIANKAINEIQKDIDEVNRFILDIDDVLGNIKRI